MINKKKFNYYFLIIILLILLGLFFSIISDYIITLIFGAFFAIVFYPFYNYLNNKFNLPNFNAFVVVFIVSFLLLSILILIIYLLIGEVNYLITNFNNIGLRDYINNCNYNFCNDIKNFGNSLIFNYKSYLIKFKEFFFNSIINTFSFITNTVINLVIFLLSFFFLLRDGKSFLIFLKKILPISDDEKEVLFDNFKNVVKAVFVDTILIAFIQGSLVGFMFWLLGLRAPVLWSLVSTFFALIPSFGTSIVWLPVVIYLFIVKNYISAIVLLIWCLFVVSLVDNLLRPLLINNKVKVNFLIVMISILGAIKTYGLIGLFLGPIIVSLLITFIKFYEETSVKILK